MLPSDILFMIFEIIVVEDRSSSAMIPLSHVCKFWRHLAIESPCLWTYVQYIFDHLGKYFTPRSKEAPLYLNIGFEHAEGPEMDYLVRHIGRTRELEIGMVGRQSHEKLKEVLSAPQNVIEAFKLYRVGPAVTVLEFPGLFGDNAPRLRELELIQVSTCSLTVFTGLTRLVIRGSSLGGMDLMSALRKMPHLQTLDLRITGLPGCDPHYRGDQKPSLVAHLPSLRTMYISGQLRECVYLMVHVEVPPSVNLTLHTTHRNGTPVAEPRLLQFLQYHSRSRNATKQRFIFQDINSDHERIKLRTDRLEWSMALPEMEEFEYISAALARWLHPEDYGALLIDLEEINRELNVIRLNG